MTAVSWPHGRAGVVGSALLVAVLGLLETGVASAEAARRATDLLQLGLSGGAALACLASARAASTQARPFWALLGMACFCWGCGQAFWASRLAPFSPEATYAEADVLFSASTALLLVAFVVRPDRGRVAPWPRAIDVAVVLVAMLYLYCQIALPHLLTGDLGAYEAWSTFLFDFRGLLLLPAILWVLRYATPAFRPLYVGLAPALVLLQGGGAFSNQSFVPGSTPGGYHPGFHDLPWTLPFVWLALAALAWREPPPAAPGAEQEADWHRARRATVVAFVAVLLFPLAHFATAWGEAAGTPLARWRASVAVAGTLLVAGLYLVRQQLVMREAERALREGEERYEALLDGGTDGVGVYGADLRVLYLSRATARLGGYRPEERVGGFAHEVVHPQDVPRLRELVAALLAAPGMLARASFRAWVRDGSWRHVEIDAVNRLDTPGVRGIVANFRDVTELRLAEQERERSLSLLEAALESTADGILAVSRDGSVERFNQRFAAMWRVPPELLRQGDARPVLACLSDQLQDPRALDAVREGAAELASASFAAHRLRDGRVVERYSLPQRLAGEVVGCVHSFRDVTERVRAEQVMARMVAVVEATPDFVSMCDASFRPLHMNRAGRRMLGLPEAGALAERHIREYHPAAAATRVLDEAVPAALERSAWSGESRLLHRDGREIPVLQVVLAHRSARGEVEFYSTIARDITQRIETERRLRESQTMAALGSLVAGVAHEVRNPLFGMTSSLDAFEARFGADHAYRPYLAVLRAELGRLNQLMQDLLEYAKPTALELVLGRFEEVVGQALAAAAPLRARTGGALETCLAEGLPPVRMDRRRLVQVLGHLLAFALERAGPHGRVRLEASRAPAGVECRVDDDGPALADDELPRVFEPFFARHEGGTGLGLSIARRIVADHGGTVSASRRDDGGGRLAFSLPAGL